jgi:hypothetical protein
MALGVWWRNVLIQSTERVAADNMNPELKAQHFLQIFRKADLKCFFTNPPLTTRRVWDSPFFRTASLRAKVYAMLDKVELCVDHLHLPDGCYCPTSPLSNNKGQSSHFSITVIKWGAELEMRQLMRSWPEFVRWRNIADGPITCVATGVTVDLADLVRLSGWVDQVAIEEHIRTFNCL